MQNCAHTTIFMMLHCPFVYLCDRERDMKMEPTSNALPRPVHGSALTCLCEEPHASKYCSVCDGRCREDHAPAIFSAQRTAWEPSGRPWSLSRSLLSPCSSVSLFITRSRSDWGWLSL